MKNIIVGFGFGLVGNSLLLAEDIKPVRTEVVTPLHVESFNLGGKAKERKQGGGARQVAGCLAFDGSMDGNRQVDPQIAVGGGFVFHGTNNGFIIYTKKGEFVQGVKQNVFNGGIDPKIFYNVHEKVFGFDIWNPWDKEKKKPVNVSVSETSDPTKAWNTYPISVPEGRDGGGIGYSRKWIGYEYPGGPAQNFVLKMADAKAGKPAKVYHFSGNMGDPVSNQDADDFMHFLRITGSNFVITRVEADANGDAIAKVIADVPHGMKNFNWPPKSPQKGSEVKVSSGDRRPKNLVQQDGCIWFSHTINHEGRAAIQWHQLKLDGTLVQRGLIAHPKNNYIQTTIAVNKRNDVLVGFQEAGPDMFISPRMALRMAGDKPGTVRKVLDLGTGQGAADGVAWGDYSGSTIDGDDLTNLWTIQSITDKEGKGDTIIVRAPFAEKGEKKE